MDYDAYFKKSHSIVMFYGSIPALVTPLTDVGEVDFTSLDRLIEWHIKSGSAALVLCGTTGEGSLLSQSEKVAIFRRAVQVSASRIPIIANCSEVSTAAAVDLACFAKDAGCAAALLIDPYYVKPSFEGILSHYKMVSEVGIPIIAYHNPGRTGCKHSASELSQILRLPGVVALKESSGDIPLAQELCCLGFHLLAGDDPLFLPMKAVGACGIVSVTANLLPEKWTKISKLENMQDVRRELNKINPLMQVIFSETNPIGVKYALSKLGFVKPIYRSPMTPPREGLRKEIDRELKKIQLLQVGV